VAFLVPTTVLARQHFDTVRARFDGYPLHCAMLSRFNSREENSRVVAGLASGTIDVVVGTHRLLQKDVRFARLGLLVVDEEHRFGVAAKERIKRLRREVDVLTMTATPIPRTLQLALSGVRDLSLIETPPVDRLAIRTYVARHDEGLVKQAIERELARGGQTFYVHNRVASIATVASRLRELLPKARIAVGHGQMDESELERVMLGFLAHEFDVLVCTSIIESGLDIPNANTIVVDRADTFGLAQLYQIRGRVGRSHRRAFAYLLVPYDRTITDEARRRLEVLQELDDLGSGFRVAAHDMEIRGAGNLLGKQQSGHVAAVGFELFMQMMEEAAKELRGESTGPHVEPEIELGVEAFLPDDYIPDIGERLLMYKRLANAESREALDGLAEEIVDRFGPLPREAKDFLRVMTLRPALKRLAVESLKANDGTVALRFHPDSPIDRELLVRLATESPRRFGLRPGGVFTLALQAQDWEAMVDAMDGFLIDLESAGRGAASDESSSASGGASS
jgi:transcription-repair coupling factor (superfamily II helicase)